ncbi:MAG: hypothetical protein V9F04_08460 [Dermatophilaceae bacterium]
MRPQRDEHPAAAGRARSKHGGDRTIQTRGGGDRPDEPEGRRPVPLELQLRQPEAEDRRRRVCRLAPVSPVDPRAELPEATCEEALDPEFERVRRRAPGGVPESVAEVPRRRPTADVRRGAGASLEGKRSRHRREPRDAGSLGHETGRWGREIGDDDIGSDLVDNPREFGRDGHEDLEVGAQLAREAQRVGPDLGGGVGDPIEGAGVVGQDRVGVEAEGVQLGGPRGTGRKGHRHPAGAQVLADRDQGVEVPAVGRCDEEHPGHRACSAPSWATSPRTPGSLA